MRDIPDNEVTFAEFKERLAIPTDPTEKSLFLKLIANFVHWHRDTNVLFLKWRGAKWLDV